MTRMFKLPLPWILSHGGASDFQRLQWKVEYSPTRFIRLQ